MLFQRWLCQRTQWGSSPTLWCRQHWVFLKNKRKLFNEIQFGASCSRKCEMRFLLFIFLGKCIWIVSPRKILPPTTKNQLNKNILMSSFCFHPPYFYIIALASDVLLFIAGCRPLWFGCSSSVIYFCCFQTKIRIYKCSELIFHLHPNFQLFFLLPYISCISSIHSLRKTFIRAVNHILWHI